MRALKTSAALLALTLLPSALVAQTAQRWSIQVSGIGNLVGDFSDGELDPGGGGELQLRLTPGAVSIGLGLESIRQKGQRTCARDARDGCFDEDLDVEVVGVFLEPRLVFPLGSRAAFYASGRFGASSVKRMSTHTDYHFADPTQDAQADARFVGTTSEADWSGWTANVGGGLLFRLSGRVNLDVGATVGRKGFGSGTVTLSHPNADVVNETEVAELGTVNNAVLRVGIAIGLGG